MAERETARGMRTRRPSVASAGVGARSPHCRRRAGLMSPLPHRPMRATARPPRPTASRRRSRRRGPAGSPIVFARARLGRRLNWDAQPKAPGLRGTGSSHVMCAATARAASLPAPAPMPTTGERGPVGARASPCRPAARRALTVRRDARAARQPTRIVRRNAERDRKVSAADFF
ncbi:hypothetical protein [Burkholderia thailandensis]|uniref:hypothetical protein n=1 Tax=Burkholderia thailandensis TaxID=57975 RepID=UPI000A926788|nr:hypothetical protein [Burkholderia thailandensis]MBS2130681.1 hypothetical protein [Burkholderia thailandensis]MCS3397865.1 hypothetical protein [Burkholderia thailandensis]MCS6470304.1 hypothetical protein [Burkholderia thailandensis]MCS6477011.1 hypothetical protein [Burkholderia thailandensis]MCS6500110.1 hypothetical protein [Burkholderia thailandensis]